jgi:triosephosphate isomerase (TIM)
MPDLRLLAYFCNFQTLHFLSFLLKKHQKMRQKIVAGNWKMNKTYTDGIALAHEVAQKATAGTATVILGVPAPFLKGVHDAIANTNGFHVAAQNCYQEEKGAFTGEISVDMIASVGASYVILGHSERRQYFKENNAILAKKTDIVLKKGLIPIFCCGESLAVREGNRHVAYIAKQLKEGVFHLSESDFNKIVIAYEPIWAIGTGKTATSAQAQDMHAAIRKMIEKRYGKAVADATRILYGGSCNAKNAKEIFSQPDVDGGLIGGASLVADDFATIIAAAQ